MRLWVVQSFVSSQILFATGAFLKINAIVSSVSSLASWTIFSTVVFVGDSLAYC